jgi:hypothetical protein
VRRRQRQQAKFSYLAAKDKLLATIRPIPSKVIWASQLEEFRANPWSGEWCALPETAAKPGSCLSVWYPIDVDMDSFVFELNANDLCETLGSHCAAQEPGEGGCLSQCGDAPELSTPISGLNGSSSSHLGLLEQSCQTGGVGSVAEAVTCDAEFSGGRGIYNPIKIQLDDFCRSYVYGQASCLDDAEELVWVSSKKIAGSGQALGLY